MRRPWTWARRLTAAGFLGLLVLGSSDWFPWFGGSISGTTLLGVIPFIDPLAAIECCLASRTVTMDLFLGATILLAATAVLGPVFCGWICPLGLLLDLNQNVRDHVSRFLGWSLVRPFSENHSCNIRIGVLASLVGFALVAGLPLFQVLSPISLFVRAIIFQTYPGLLLVAAIVLIEYRWPRLWCRTLCPLGALHGLVGRTGRFRVWINPVTAGRNPCRNCTLHCPMGIRVMEDHVLKTEPSVTDPHCIRCGECVERCPGDVLKLGFGGMKQVGE